MSDDGGRGALHRDGDNDVEVFLGGNTGAHSLPRRALPTPKHVTRARSRTKRGLILIAAALLTGAAGVGAREVAQKVIEIRYRLQLIEARQDSLGRTQAVELEREQVARDAARFAVPLKFSGFVHGGWKQIGGPEVVPGWPKHYSLTKALAVHQDRLYVGLSRPNQAPAQVWRFDGAAWERIGSAETVPSWARHYYVSALVSDGATLYAGLGDTVWAYDTARGWRQIGGDGVAGSWPAGSNTNAYALALFRGRLVVGMVGGRQAAVYTYESGRWEKIAGDGIRDGWSEDRYTGVYELWHHSDGYLYAGLIANPGPTAVFRFDGARWEKIGGDGVNGSWRNPGFTYALSFASLDGRLVVSMDRNPMAAANFSSIWAFDGRSWRPVGLGHIPALWGEMHNYNAVAAYRGRLVIGAGGHPAGNASVWALEDGVRPVMVGGHGVNGSWGGGDRSALGLTDSVNMEHVYRFVVWRGDLVAGFSRDPGSAGVWRHRSEPDPQPARPNGQQH
jgi:hypothetical protein